MVELQILQLHKKREEKIERGKIPSLLKGSSKCSFKQIKNMLRLVDIRVSGDNLIAIHGQECSDILKANYEDRKNTDEIWKVGKDMKLAGRIPLAVYLEWQKQGITDDPEALLRMLEKHPEYKTTTKRLI